MLKDKTKRVGNATLSVLVFFLVAGAARGVVSHFTEPSSAEIVNSPAYMSEFRSGFMETCNSDGQSGEGCACVYNQVAADTPRLQYYLDNYKTMSDAEVTAFISPYVDQCI